MSNTETAASLIGACVEYYAADASDGDQDATGRTQGVVTGADEYHRLVVANADGETVHTLPMSAVLVIAEAPAPEVKAAKPVKLSPAMRAALYYFANPTPANAAHCKAMKAKGATDAALRSRGLIEATDTFPFHQPTEAGWDLYVALADCVSSWIEHAKTATLTDGFEPVTEAQAVDAVRKALTELTVRGLKPALAAAELRALNARFPEPVKAEPVAPQYVTTTGNDGLTWHLVDRNGQPVAAGEHVGVSGRNFRISDRPSVVARPDAGAPVEVRVTFTECAEAARLDTWAQLRVLVPGWRWELGPQRA